MGTHTSNGETSVMGYAVGDQEKEIEAKHHCLREKRGGKEEDRQCCNRSKEREQIELVQPAFPPQRDREEQRVWGTPVLTLTWNQLSNFLCLPGGKECQPGFPSLFCSHFPNSA